MIGHIKDLHVIEIHHPAAKHASMKALVSKEEGWESHVMRVVEVEKDGYSPKHQHPWPHINYILEGIGEIMIDGKITEVQEGSYAYIPGNTMHQFINKGDKTFKFICIVPTEGHVY